MSDQPSLPSELLREIVITVFTDYLEGIMPSYALHLIRQFSVEEELFTWSTTLEMARKIASLQITEDEFYLPGPYDHNHFFPLLHTSYQQRNIALSVPDLCVSAETSQGVGMNSSYLCGMCE